MRSNNLLAALINDGISTFNLREHTYGGDAMAIHNFSNENPDKMQQGRAFLNKSDKSYAKIYGNDERDEEIKKEDYLQKYLKPVFDDLLERIDNGEWDYTGETIDDLTVKEANKRKREDQKTQVKYLISVLKEGDIAYGKNDSGVEEIVQFHDLLVKEAEREEQEEKELNSGSPFVILFENLLESSE